MEFWVGLSVGMHLGKMIADNLEKVVEAYGLLDSPTIEKAKEKIERRAEVCSIMDRLVD